MPSSFPLVPDLLIPASTSTFRDLTAPLARLLVELPLPRFPIIQYMQKFGLGRQLLNASPSAQCPRRWNILLLQLGTDFDLNLLLNLGLCRWPCELDVLRLGVKV